MSGKYFVVCNNVPKNAIALTSGKFYELTSINVISTLFGDIVADNGVVIRISVGNPCAHLRDEASWTLMKEVTDFQEEFKK